MAYYNTGCGDCGGFRFVTNSHDGDVTCTGCGLVQEQRLLMDDGFHNQSVMDETSGQVALPAISNIDHRLGEYIASFGVSNVSSFLTVAKDVYTRVKDKYAFRGLRLNAIMACCVYISFKLVNTNRIARDASEVCKRLGVDNKVFAKAMKDVIELCPMLEAKMKRVKEDDSVIRQLQEVIEVDANQVHKLAALVGVLDEIRSKNNIMMGTSPMIVNAILIFVAAANMGIKINKTCYLTHGWVSRATLDKHVHTIKLCLSKNKKNISV